MTMKVILRMHFQGRRSTQRCIGITRIRKYVLYGMDSRYPEFDGTREPAAGGGGREARPASCGQDLVYKYAFKPAVEHLSAAWRTSACDRG